CVAVTDETLVKLTKAPCARKLRHLQLSFCEGISDAGLITLVKSCERLRNIELDNSTSRKYLFSLSALLLILLFPCFFLILSFFPFFFLPLFSLFFSFFSLW